MTIPVSPAKTEKKEAKTKIPSFVSAAKQNIDQETVQVRVVQCCNDFVAILQSQIDTILAMSDNDSVYKNEGLVIGVGPGLTDGAGGRLKPCVDVGDFVMFGIKNIVAVIESSSPPYAGKKVIIVSEKNILCKLPKDLKIEYVG